MEPNKIGTLWLVEEKDHITGDVRFSQTYSDYSDAMTTYSERKRVNLVNTVSIEKCERTLLQE